MSTAVKGYGAILSWSADGTTYTAVGQTVDLSGPEPEVGDIDITNNDSPANTMEYIAGMIEPGTQDYECIFVKAVLAALATKLGDNVIYFWRELLIDGSKWEFKGYLKKLGTDAPTVNGAIRNTITLKLTSKPVFTPAP